MRGIYLHIGLPKCGSTTIQDGLCRHAAPLARSGVAVLTPNELRPTRMVGHMTGRFVPELRGCHRLVSDRWRRRRWLAYLANREWMAHPAVDPCSVRDELGRLIDRSGASRIICSDEALLHFAMPYAGLSADDYYGFAIEQLRQGFAGRSCRVILFVRAQDRFLESAYCQQVRLLGAPTGFHRYLNGHIDWEGLDWFRLAERLVHAFGEDRLVVFPLDAAQAGNGLPPRDMLGLLLSAVLPDGASLPDLATDGTMRNPGPSAMALTMLRLGGPLHWRWDSYRRFQSRVEERFPVGRYCRPRLLDEAQRAAIRSRFADSNDRLFAVFMPRYRALRPLWS